MISPRWIIFQLHWFFGITAGLVLAFMGVTGAIMSFENEIMQGLSTHAYVEPAGRTALTPDQLIARVREQRPDREIASLQMQGDPTLAPVVAFKRDAKKGETRNPRPFVDPYTGALLGEATASEFFILVRALHRWLALPGETGGIGGYITGISTLALIFFALSGLFLRWPKKALDWRSWFKIDLSLSGRSLWRALHAVIGSWLMIFYLVSAFSGMWWAFGWYKSFLTGVLTSPPAVEESKVPKKPKSEKAGTNAKSVQNGVEDGSVALDLAWTSFVEKIGGDFDNVIIAIPQPGKAARFRALPHDVLHDRMVDEFMIQPKDGKIVRQTMFTDVPFGEQVILSMDPIHSGAWAGLTGRIVMMGTSLTLPFFAVSGLILYSKRRRKKREAKAVALPAQASGGLPDILVVYASQTGTAERLARQTALQLIAGGVPTALKPLSGIRASDLCAYRQFLFVASTYGEGEAPDMAAAFARKIMSTPAKLGHLRYGLLALGDRHYADFCGFGRRLDKWMRASGARPLFERIELDGEDQETVGLWHEALTNLGAGGAPPALQFGNFSLWRLEEREHLNPGSVGLPVWRVVLRALEPDCFWKAGDIAEIRPGDPTDTTLPLREYSIASLPEDGMIELVVRQVKTTDGGLGLGSGWLTEHAALGSDIMLRLRENTNFHPQPEKRPAIFIGNGTGISGLHAQLRAREKAGEHDNWLIFGERNSRFDCLLGDRLRRWSDEGHLKQLDCAFSRDQETRVYVQHVVAGQMETLRAWVQNGAAIYVCGSLGTMAPAVDRALRKGLGDDAVDLLIEQGRYLRDVY